MRGKWITAVLLALIVVSGSVAAQDEALNPVSICTEEENTAFTDALLALLQAPPENADMFVFLDSLTAVIETHRWKCSGMVLSGENEDGKASVVVGPIGIPDGIYLVTLTTDDFFIGSATELSGDCRLSFAALEGEASGGTEEIFEYDDDCSMLLEVEARAPWTIQFVPVGGGD